MVNKSGISAIVATVLVILITVAAVTLIWTGVIPLIKDEIDFEDPDLRLTIVTAEGYTVYDAEKEIATVQVERGADEAASGSPRIPRP